jgi:competence protein ComEA
MKSYRTIVMVVLAFLAGMLVLSAVVLLTRGDDNAPIQIWSSPAIPEQTTEADNSSSPLVVQTSPSMSAFANAGAQKGADSQLRIYISGAVLNPGVYALQAGDRLVDGLAVAGGATEDADLSQVNLARRIRDEEHYHIPRVGESLPPVSTTTDGLLLSPTLASAQTSKGLIDLNTATVDLLVTLPGIGPVKAMAIVDYRNQNDGFRSIEDIINVPGIGTATYENIRHLVTVGGTP